MSTRRNALAGAFLAALMVAAVPAIAEDDAGRRAGGVAAESARTGGHAVRDGFLTFGRTVKSFFTGGPNAARETWRENAAETRENARVGAAAVRGEANR
jgi:hypothetical protein